MNHSSKNSSSKKSTLIKLLIYILVIGSFLTLPLNVQAGVSTQDTSENLYRIRSGQTGATQKSPVTRGDLIGKLRPPFSPAPSVTVSTGGVLLGENFNITATFENNGTASGYGPTGYGPFIDLYLPHKGADGVYPTESTYDGISPASGPNYTATLPDGEVLNVITQTFPDDGGGTGCVNHPWGLDTAGFFLSVCGTAGDQLVSIELPYGSYTPAQPTLTVTIPARLSEYANPGTPLTIRGRGGFKYGATPAVDWCCTVPIDTTIVSDTGAPATWVPFSSVNPSVISFSKSTSAGEVATGPNSPATFTISVDLAPNQIFYDIDISDIVPNNLVYLGGLSTSPAADTISQPAVDGLPHNGDSISLHWDGPIDSSVCSAISASFDYYIPEFDADGFDIAPDITQNQAALDQIWWSPADGASDQELSSSVGVGTATTSDQPLTLAKASTIVINNGPSGYTPEDVIQYSLSFQISDYFGFDNLSLEDILPDGQHYYTDGTYQPSLSITRDGSTISYSFDADNITVDCNYTGAPGSECDLASSTGSPGQTTVTFDIDQELTDQLANSQVLGDLVNDAGPTVNLTVTGTVLFYAEMLDKYTDIFASPDNYVKMGDSQNNSAVITGDQVNPATCNPGPCTVTATVSGNSASNTVNVGSGALDKAIVAVNGAYCAGGNPCSDVNIAAGDTVTYRILYDLLTGDYSDLSFTDFLPLPIFYAEDPNVDGSSLTSWPQDLVNAIPDPGTWILGPNDDRGHLPSNVSISPHTANNSVIFEFGDFDDTDNLPKSIELHFTVRVTDEQFGDGLRMRNSVLQQDSNSPGVTSTSNNNVDLTLTEPVLVGDKSVVSTDHAGIDPDPTIEAPIIFLDPGDTVNPPWNTGSPINSTYLDANSLNSGIDGIDGGDLVKFALIIENTGSGINGAYDIALRDHLPPGYLLPGSGLGGFNLQIYRGDGLALDDGTGSGLEFLGSNNNATDFFDNGIRLRDPEDNPAFAPGDPEYGQGLCQAHEAASGKNVIILTYDLLVDPDVSPGSVLQNDGEIISYSGEEGGENYIPEPGDGSTDSTVAVHELDKQRTGTELDVTNNDDDQVVIGEEIYYELIVTFPEGISPSMVNNRQSGQRFGICKSGQFCDLK
ncbi:MAG: hypothetical protein J7L35_05330 [Anaerolineales bacterium]|nr:hypothetical protein [Anaerolineales bacterium]